ncbi:MAG: carboxypeptidase-like regulatory domain-containing protein [Tannerella sp.]|nr:carboxypeptidase-like regulatory domain-containing protein [Tannerella sp.]
MTERRTIAGYITDANTGEPVIGATVFIAQTSIGVLTDLEGNYRFNLPGEGSYQLVVSHVGYQSVFMDIEPGSESVEIDVALNNNVLEEVTVEQKIRFRQQDIDLFWETVLGKSPSPKTIYPVNPEDVYYYYNRETRILTVTCRVPLQIINPETGYAIQFVLDHFYHDYNTDISSWYYEFMFSELEPENDDQQDIWNENREKVYSISLQNFIKSLYNNTLPENGFLLASVDITEKTGEDDNYLGARSRRSISAAQSDSRNSHNISDFYENTDSLISTDSFWDTKTLSIPTDDKHYVMLICFGKPIEKAVFQKEKKIAHANSNFFNEFAMNLLDSGLARNIIQTPSDSVEIFPDGTYIGDLILLPYENSLSLQGLNLKLPLDYSPE